MLGPERSEGPTCHPESQLCANGLSTFQTTVLVYLLKLSYSVVSNYPISNSS